MIPRNFWATRRVPRGSTITTPVQCQTCHGLDGLSKLPEAPHLAGRRKPIC
jgi:cytochrome c553